MKKNNKKLGGENTAQRREADRYSDKAVQMTVLTILYAFVLLFLQRMSRSSATVLGAVAFIRILFWCSIVGAMLCAAWGAYKERRGTLVFSGIFAYILWSTAVIQYCGNMGSDKAYALVYASLFTAFVLSEIYFTLRSMGKLEAKRSRIIFAVICVLLFLLFSFVALGLCFKLFRFFSFL